MRKLLTILLATILIAMSGNIYANGSEPGNEGTKLNLWIPSFLTKIVAGIADDHVKGEELEAVSMLKKFGNITICIREGEFYSDKSDKKITRKLDKMERKNYSELLSVMSEGEKVNMSIKEKKNGTIKRMILVVDDPGEAYVYIKLNCKISPEDIARFTSAFMTSQNTVELIREDIN